MDIKNETVHVDSVSDVSPASLGSSITTEGPRYSFYRHSSPEAPILFIYTCPSSSKVREKMIYAAAKRSVHTWAERTLGMQIAKRVGGLIWLLVCENRSNRQCSLKLQIQMRSQNLRSMMNSSLKPRLRVRSHGPRSPAGGDAVTRVRFNYSGNVVYKRRPMGERVLELVAATKIKDYCLFDDDVYLVYSTIKMPYHASRYTGHLSIQRS